MRYRLLGTVEQVMDSEMDVPELEDHGDPWRKDLGKHEGKIWTHFYSVKRGPYQPSNRIEH
jgi:hypothetical protein